MSLSLVGGSNYSLRLRLQTAPAPDTLGPAHKALTRAPRPETGEGRPFGPPPGGRCRVAETAGDAEWRRRPALAVARALRWRCNATGTAAGAGRRSAFGFVRRSWFASSPSARINAGQRGSTRANAGLRGSTRIDAGQRGSTRVNASQRAPLPDSPTSAAVMPAGTFSENSRRTCARKP